MKATRVTGIPIAHVTAETVAFPLASIPALMLAPYVLDPKLANGTDELWRAAERAIVRSLPGFSIEEAVAIRDKIWFGDSAGGIVPLHAYLRRIAHEHLEPHGVVAIPTLHPDESKPVYDSLHSREAMARWRWRWLSLALPPDLLLAALPPNGGLTPSRVDSVSSLIDRQLADGTFSESHVHLGAAVDFPLIWVLVLHTLADTAIRPDLFASPGADLQEGRLLGPWLMRAACLRYLLAAYLAAARPERSFQAFLAGEVRERLSSRLGAGFYALLLEGLVHLQSKDLYRPDRADFARWQMLYRQLTGLSYARLPDDRTSAMKTDPIAIFLPSRHPDYEPAETRFVVRALDYLETPDDGDPLFARLFWQVVRIRNLVYRHMVQRPMTPGLQWFIRFYSRLRPARQRASYQLRLAAAAEVCGWKRGLASLEVRTSPERSASDIFRELREMGEVAARWRRSDAEEGRDFLEFGVIYHFSKDRGGKALEGRPQPHWRQSHADPQSESNPSGYRYAGYFKEKEREAVALIWVLRNLPAAAELVRGVDVCTDEMGVPFWVIAPLLRAVRRAGDEAVRKMQVDLGIEVSPLRTTIHAGEDYVHLLTGLRHIDEAIHQFDLKEGDRLGHAMALGVDAPDWALRAGRIAMSREVRLFDLAWEWHWYWRSGTPVATRRRSLLEGEIARLSHEIFGHRYEIHDLVDLIGSLHSSRRLWHVGFPDCPVPRFAPRDGVDSMLRQYLTCPLTFRRGREIEWVDPEIEGEVLAEIQAGIRRNINNRGFTIEVNPSSNLLIGDLGDLARHPLWRLNPPVGDCAGPPLGVCIGSDDPLTFGTSLPYEYQLIYDAFILSGVSGENAQRWLDNARMCGLKARFTLPRRRTSHILALKNVTGAQIPILLAS